MAPFSTPSSFPVPHAPDSMWTPKVRPPADRQRRCAGALGQEGRQSLLRLPGSHGSRQPGWLRRVRAGAPSQRSGDTKLPEIIEQLEPSIQAVLADKGYASQANRQWLKDHGIGDLIEHKGTTRGSACSGRRGIRAGTRTKARDLRRPPCIGSSAWRTTRLHVKWRGQRTRRHSG